MQLLYQKNIEYNNNTTTLRNSDLPQRYNLAEHYDIKVENQGEEGNCWTFASLETLETYLQMHGYETFDFSENHLNYVESDLFSETEASVEEGQKERVCLKNANHKEIAKIDKISEEQYEFIEGAGQTYTEGEEGATFRINADYNLFKNGGKVYVDENFVNSKYYISESGSTIITLTKEYMNSLSEGEHTLKVAFNDGKYAITKFNIDKSNNTSSPKTSDNIESYFYIILISVISFSVILIIYRKR